MRDVECAIAYVRKWIRLRDSLRSQPSRETFTHRFPPIKSCLHLAGYFLLSNSFRDHDASDKKIRSLSFFSPHITLDPYAYHGEERAR